MATDLGRSFHDRRHLQNTTDAPVLAGAAQLPLHPDKANRELYRVPITKVLIEGRSLAYLSSYSCVDGTDCSNGHGHWEVQIQIVDAAYSQSTGFLGECDPDSGITIRRLID